MSLTFCHQSLLPNEIGKLIPDGMVAEHEFMQVMPFNVPTASYIS